MNRNQLIFFLLLSLVLSGCGVPEEEHSELSQQLKGVKNSLTKANEELDFAAKTVDEKDKKIAELEGQIEIIKEQNASFTSKEPELNEQITQLQAKLDKVSAQRDVLQTNLAEKDEQLKKFAKLEQDLSTQMRKLQNGSRTMKSCVLRTKSFRNALRKWQTAQRTNLSLPIHWSVIFSKPKGPKIKNLKGVLI